jgi:hypothetical protein
MAATAAKPVDWVPTRFVREVRPSRWRMPSRTDRARTRACHSSAGAGADTPLGTAAGAAIEAKKDYVDGPAGSNAFLLFGLADAEWRPLRALGFGQPVAHDTVSLACHKNIRAERALAGQPRGRFSNSAPCSTPRGERVASICRDAPRPDNARTAQRGRRLKGAAPLLARRERSHAQPRPFFAGEASMASTHPLTRLSTVLSASPW